MRRLPILQPSAAEEDDEDRPPWHWAALGTVAVFAAWLPLAWGINTLIRRALDVEEGGGAPGSVQAAMVLTNAAGFAMAGLAGGYLVGRHGGRAGLREATASGVVAAAIAWGLALMQGAPAGVLGWAAVLVVMASLGGGAARGGGVIGLRRRPRI